MASAIGLLAAAARAQPESARAVVAEVAGADLVVLEDGRRVRLQGLTLPAAVVRPESFESELRQFLRRRLEKRRVSLVPEERNSPGDDVDLTAILRTESKSRSINEEALAAGLAVFGCRTPEVVELDQLRAAAAEAQQAGRGWFSSRAKRLPAVSFLNGAVLGLHYQEPHRDYHRQIDELVTAGFEHVCLLFSAFLADVRATAIDRDHVRCVRDERLVETIRYAKSKGLSVMLLPILLLLDAEKDEWRGTLRPSDEAEFWLEYDRFLCHYLDIAEVTGVDIFSIGSELGSLERQTDVWSRLIAQARGRFRGLLSYSANWDHVHVPRFFGQLDMVGMTAYFSLTEKRDPSLEELVAGWKKIAGQLGRSVGMLGKPVVFTEIGYASQDGINTDPWNYLMNKDQLDLQEQAHCFEAFLEVVPSMSFLRGAYFYDYFDLGGPDDHSYSPRGKPAFEQWKSWARYRPGG